jgi:hypothetical protein
MATYRDYQSAAALLWGAAGEFAADEFTRLNRELFAGSIPPMPIIVAMVPYGGCIAATSYAAWLKSPRITLTPEIFNGSVSKPTSVGYSRPGRLRGGPHQVTDTLMHEMVHAALRFRGENSNHNEPSWCRMITDLSATLLGVNIDARPVRTRRVPNPARETDPAAPKTIVKRLPMAGAMAQMELARWPQSIRPADWYDDDKPIYVPTY